MSTLTKTEEFLGLPVVYETEPYVGTSHVDQRPIEELRPLIFAVLEHPLIAGVRWNSYIPAFNDGDVCEYTVSGFRVQLTEDFGIPLDEDQLDDNEYGDGDGVRLTHYDDRFDEKIATSSGYHDARTWSGPEAELAQAIEVLEKAVEGGAFDVVLETTFGSNSTVTVRQTGITVDEYDCGW